MRDNSFDFQLNSFDFSNDFSFNNYDPFSLNLNENFDSFNNENFIEDKTNLNDIDNTYNFNQLTINKKSIEDGLKVDYNTKNKTQDTTNIAGKNNTQMEHKEDLLQNENKDNRKLLNRKREKKRKNPSDGEKHSKFSSDNTIRKVKHITLDETKDLINEKIRKIYGNIGYGISQKKLLILNQEQKANATINYNKEFIFKKLYEIFSDKISGKYTNYDGDFNKNLINRLMNEEDLNKRQYFRRLFNLTFFDCLLHFRGSQKIKELEGLKSFSEHIKEKEYDKDYIIHLKYYIDNYEKILRTKRSRQTRNNNQNNNKDKDNQKGEVKTIMIDSNC